MSKFLEKRYQVNVLVDRRGEQGVPVVFDPVPTFQNLFGKIEKTAVQGVAATDFTMVQAGSLLRANKGFLVLEIDAVLRHPEVWETLKTTLQNRKLYIQDPPDQTGPAMASLRPDPIDLDVKVILLGGYDIFRVLQNADPKFSKIFKVRADFDYEVDVSLSDRKTPALHALRGDCGGGICQPAGGKPAQAVPAVRPDHGPAQGIRLLGRSGAGPCRDP
jgi:predicted ATP-dependent protease